MATTKNQKTGSKPNVPQSTKVANEETGRHADAEEHAEHQTTAEKVTEKVVRAAHSEDEPMGRQTPEAPFALVGLSYLAALALVVLIVAFVAFMVLN